MRLATGFLVALVVCLWLGVAEAVVPPAPQTGACPLAGNKASVCDKATACNKEAACSKASGTACATQKACGSAKARDSAAACQGQHGCENAACKDAVMAAMFGKMVIGSDAANCSKLTACTTKACASEPGCETACASKKACCQAAACEAGAACAAASECPQVIATDHASACESGNCCQANVARLAMASDETCEGGLACGASACCQASACARGACPNTVKLRHLVQAAEHLTAAGLTDEADCVRSMAAEVREELVAKKVAQIATLQAEIAALGGGGEEASSDVAAQCEQRPAQTVSEYMNTRPAAKSGEKTPQQVSVNVKCVEVSLSMMKKLGFSFETIEPNGWEKGDAKGILGFMHALEREHLVKVLACPTATLPDGGGFQVANQELGRLNVQAKLLDNQHVRMEIRHIAAPFIAGSGPAGRDVSPGKVQAFDTGIELEFGKTAVFGGQVRDRLTAEQDPDTHEPKMVRSEVQTLILVTPELVEPVTAVSPASHQEPSDEPKAKPHHEGERRVKAIRLFDILPGQPQPRVRYSFPAETR